VFASPAQSRLLRHPPGEPLDDDTLMPDDEPMPDDEVALGPPPIVHTPPLQVNPCPVAHWRFVEQDV
jgi:hypothetical protein